MSNHGEDLSQFDISVEVRTGLLNPSLSLIDPKVSILTPYRYLNCFDFRSGFSQEKDKLVAEVIRYVLFKTHHNSGCPIRREELTQLITKNYRQRNLPVAVIDEAIKKLSTIFGYEMRELQRVRPSSNSQGRNSQQSEI